MAVTSSHSPYCRVLELLYTDNLRYGAALGVFSILNFIINNAPQAGHFLGTYGHQKVFSHRLRHTARHTNYSMYIMSRSWDIE